MALINRLSRLFTADMHAVIDRMEEPDILLRQALRDMEAAVAAGEQRALKLERQADELSAALERGMKALEALTAELDVCLDADNDELARAVLRRKLQAERQISTLRDEHARITKLRDEQHHALTEQRVELQELEQKAHVFDVAPGKPDACAPTITADEVEVALLKEKQRRAAS